MVVPSPSLRPDDVPTVNVPGGGTISALDDALVQRFRKNDLSIPAQRKIIRQLDAFLQNAYAKPQSTPELLLSRLALIDALSWQIAQCYRYSNPSRISEAVAPLTFLVESHRRAVKGAQVDTTPALYLCVALSRIEGEEQRAIELYKETMKHLPQSKTNPTRNLIWARANMARLYRQMGKTAEATEQEKLTREYILGRPYWMPPSELKDLLADDIGTGSHILDHPDLVKLFDSIQQIGPNFALTNNGTIGVGYNLELKDLNNLPPGFVFASGIPHS